MNVYNSACIFDEKRAFSIVKMLTLNIGSDTLNAERNFVYKLNDCIQNENV